MNLSKKLYLSQWCLLLLALTFLAMWAPLTVFGQPFDKTAPLKPGATAGSFDKAQPAPQYFPNVPARFASGGMNDSPASLTEPEWFPHQNAQTSNNWSCPIVLANGHVLLFWSESGNLAYSRSTDGGQTWESPGVIASTPGFDPNFPVGICTLTGRAIITWSDTQTRELMMSSSTDNGVSWTSPPQQITSSERNERWTSLSQTLDGKLWLFYADNVDGNARDIFYRASYDDGASWSGEQTFRATAADEEFGTVISIDISFPLAFFSDNSAGNYSIYQMSSGDGGLTWSPPVVIGEVYQNENRPRALRHSDGTLRLIYVADAPTPVLPGMVQGDIYSITRSNGGSFWSQPQKFTQYIGGDGGHNTALLNNHPFVTFNSNRWANFNQNQIWYGIIGITTDSSLPPALFRHEIVAPLPGQPVTARAHVDDESGISNVTITYTLNGVTTGPFPMYDDGYHNDNNPSDNIWGTDIGPFQIGDIVAYWFNISDNSANSVEVDAGSFDMPPVHTAGNVFLSVHDNSILADETNVAGRSAYWPVPGGQDYLYLGGLWVGAEVSGEQRVMNIIHNERDWTHTTGTAITVAPGISDQDISLHYDDQFAKSAPIGLQVHQESYQWSGSSLDDFIIFRYTIKNTGLNGDLNNVHIAAWLDPDIANGDAGNDMGGYDYQRGLAYLYDPGQNPAGYLGIKLFGAIPNTVNFYAIPNDPANDQQRFQYMTAGIQPNANYEGDWRILLTAPPFNLAAGESYTVGFGLVMGANGELQANTDAMISLYEQEWGVSQPIPSPTGLIAIDKLNSKVDLYWDPSGGEQSFNIYRKGPSDPSFNQIGTVPGGQRSYVDYNVVNDQVYEYYVTAVYLTGESDPSDITTGYPMAVPDGPGKVVSHAKPGGSPYGIAFDGANVLMSIYSSTVIDRYGPVTWEWLGSIPAPGGQGCYGMAWDDNTFWVASRTAGGVYQISPSGIIIQFLDVPPGSNGTELLTGLAYENGNIWVMDRRNFVVHKYDAASGALLQSLPMPPEFFAPASPQGLGYLPNRGTFIVGVLTDGSSKTTIYEVTTTDFTLTGRNFEFNMEYDPGSGQFNSSIRAGLTFNPLTGNYWIGDVWKNVVYEVQPFTTQNDITFQVDMRVKMQQQLFQPANGDIVVVRGNFNGWSGNNEILVDPNNYGIYNGTYNVGGSAGDEIQYKFVISYPGGGVLWEDNIPNRSFILTGNPETLPVVFFNDEPIQGGTLVTNTNDSGPGSLRAAIDFANSDGQPSLVEFYPTLLGQTIYLQSQLPTLTESNTTINGDINNDGVPDIEIRQGSPDAINGLYIESANNTIRGLLINDFFGPGGFGYSAIRITGANAHDNTIAGCYIGTDLSKNENRANRSGILISNAAHNNTVGGPDPRDKNVIYFNTNGVYVSDDGTDGNTVTRNSISRNLTGMVVTGGANDGIIPPVIADFAGSTLSGTTIPYSTVEVFADNFNQGEEFLGDTQSDGNGNFSFSGSFPENRLYNVTVTDPAGNTSQFANSLRQNEINANHWRVQLLNNGSFAMDALGRVSGGGAGGEFPKGSGIYVVYAGGHCLGTLKNGTPSVSQIEYLNSYDYLSGKILNGSPAPLDQLSAENPLMAKNKVYVIDSTRSGWDWDNWPAEDGAPLDANGDPLLLSSQDSWAVFNDVYAGVHTGTGDPVLGLEVQRSTYSYTLPGVCDAFIVKWKIINKSNNHYQDTYFGTWFDADVADWTNDLIGTDTTLNLAYCYNANDNDAPRAFGACLLKGPLADGQLLGLTATYGPAVGEDPGNDDQRYNILRGLDRWGNPKQFGPFDYTGDPVTNTGHIDVNPSDKRLIISSGPFTLYAGNVQEVVLACIGAVGANHLDAVANLRETTKRVQEFYGRPAISVSQTKGIRTYKTPVRISLSNVKNLLGADLKISYNYSLLELLPADVKLTPLTTAFSSTVKVTQNQGTVSVALANALPLKDDMAGVLVKLAFKVKNTAPLGNIADLVFTEAILTLQSDSLYQMYPVVANGSLEVVDGYLFGDVNQNGVYELTDAVFILKAVVQLYEEFTPFQELLADANKNGVLAVNDALQVLNQLVLSKPALAKEGSFTAPDTMVEVSLNLPPIQGEAGQEIQVPLRCQNFERLNGLELAFGYDPKALRLVSIEKTGEGDLFASNLQTAGYAHVAAANTNGLGNTQGELLALNFKVLVAGEHLLTVEKALGAVPLDEILGSLLPKTFELAQNYPNPFNPVTQIKYALPQPEKVEIVIYNTLGQKVKTLVSQYQEAGYYTIPWDATSDAGQKVGSGIYFYRIQAGKYSAVRKMVLVR